MPVERVHPEVVQAPQNFSNLFQREPQALCVPNELQAAQIGLAVIPVARFAECRARKGRDGSMEPALSEPKRSGGESNGACPERAEA
jgi:hypothetical protein